MKILIDKQSFVDAINSILRRFATRSQVCDKLSALGIDISADPLEDILVATLDAAIGYKRNDGLVGWWLYECAQDRDQGIASFHSCGRLVSTPEDLYDLAISQL